MSAQEFINSLNEKLMPELGYVKHEGEWHWPVYDWRNRSNADFDKANRSDTAVNIQARRLGRFAFERQTNTTKEKS